MTAELEWKQTFYTARFITVSAQREKNMGSGYSLQTKVEFFREQANTAHATPSDPQRINNFKFQFAVLFKVLIGR